jgi:hypothetical protein
MKVPFFLRKGVDPDRVLILYLLACVAVFSLSQQFLGLDESRRTAHTA